MQINLSAMSARQKVQFAQATQSLDNAIGELEDLRQWFVSDLPDTDGGVMYEILDDGINRMCAAMETIGVY